MTDSYIPLCPANSVHNGYHRALLHDVRNPSDIRLRSLTKHAHSFPSMIVCHFILSLRQIEPAGRSWASGNQSHSLRFVGNMGQSLQFGGEGADKEEEDIAGVEGTVAEVNVSPAAATRTTDIEEQCVSVFLHRLKP